MDKEAKNNYLKSAIQKNDVLTQFKQYSMNKQDNQQENASLENNGYKMQREMYTSGYDEQYVDQKQNCDNHEKKADKNKIGTQQTVRPRRARWEYARQKRIIERRQVKKLTLVLRTLMQMVEDIN